MKLRNGTLSPLAFYESIEEQNHRKWFAFGHAYQLVVPFKTIAPFQLLLHPDVDEDLDNPFYFEVSLIDFNTGKEIKQLSPYFDKRIEVVRKETFLSIVYFGEDNINELTVEGGFYIVVKMYKMLMATSVLVKTFYSEVFYCYGAVDKDDFIKLEYRNSFDLAVPGGAILFNNFTYKVWLKAIISKPDYEFKEEATERMGYTFIESQVSKKVYKFNFLAPEYLCDALRIARLCEDKKITDSLGRVYDLSSFNMDVKWLDQGDLANVECEFETDTVIANIGGYVGMYSNNAFDNETFK